MHNLTRRAFAIFAFLTLFIQPLTADEKVKEALRYKPKQNDVEYDQPNETQIDLCTLVSAKEVKKSGFIVRDQDNRTLRLYLNTNGDQNLDRWSYFKDGIEVYCDIDSNFDGKADQFRWYGSAGSRWGEDADGDGSIDRWLNISAEEVSAEVVGAIRTNDLARFKRLLLTEDELKALPLNDDLKAEIQERLTKAVSEFPNFVAKQDLVTAKTQWIQFGGIQPTTVAESTRGVNQPITIYDYVAAVIATGDKPAQIALGTLIKVGDTWRLFELPQAVAEGQALAIGGFFFRAGTGAISSFADGQEEFEEYNRLAKELETLRPKGDKEKLVQVHERLATLLRKFFKNSPADEKSNWIRQFADQVGGAFQNGEYPEGLKQLNDFIKEIDGTGVDENDVGYAFYRMISAQASAELSGDTDPKVIDEKHQDHLLRLEKFIEKYAKCEFVPEAIYQLATSAEVSNPEAATGWYARIAKEHPSSPFTPKAQGAYTRLNSIGRAIELQGKSLDNQDFRLSSLKGKIVVVHYWASWAGEHDIDELRRIQRKYAAEGVEVVGIGVDDDPAKQREFLKENAMPWTQLVNEKGLEGKLAVQLGIAIVPTTILIGKDGLVVDPRVHVDQLDVTLRKTTKSEQTAQKPSAKK